MKSFVIVSMFAERKIDKYLADSAWRPSTILPDFGERDTCFAANREFSFEELIGLFLHGCEDERIGALSMIAEKHPAELYQFILHHKNEIPKRRIRFLLNYAVRKYLPLLLRQEQLMDYVFPEEYKEDIWVKMLMEIRPLL